MSSKRQSLSIKERLFCRYYLFGCDEFKIGNGVASYAKAYRYDLKNKKKYNLSGVEAHQLLKKPKIIEHLHVLLEQAGYNDEIIDARLLNIILEGSDKNSVAAIREYNELKSRITKGLQLPKGGKGNLTISWDDGSNNPVQTEGVGAGVPQPS